MNRRMFSPSLASFAIIPLTSTPVWATQPIACGRERINLHKNNPDLLGVEVHQLPDNEDDAKAYRGTHPAMIIFVCKHGKAHQIEYTPSGQVEDGFWFDIPEGDKIYDRIDKNIENRPTCGYWVNRTQ
jgi:hypothetical protein